ncbi:hypothetical protein [Caballeronia grimmiae]|uniref:hypothetical protein n=1 Tax=Caballeronia grimmiae TaxID=1071679 RepID=UPI0038BD4138
MIVVPDGYANPSDSFASRILFAVDGSTPALAGLSIGALGEAERWNADRAG